MPALKWTSHNAAVHQLTLSSFFAGKMFFIISILASLAGLEFAAGKVYETRFKGTTWDDEKSILQTTNLDQGHYQSRMSLANGYLGINLAAGEFALEEGSDVLANRVQLVHFSRSILQ